MSATIYRLMPGAAPEDEGLICVRKTMRIGESIRLLDGMLLRLEQSKHKNDLQIDAIVSDPKVFSMRLGLQADALNDYGHLGFMIAICGARYTPTGFIDRVRVKLYATPHRLNLPRQTK